MGKILLAMEINDGRIKISQNFSQANQIDLALLLSNLEIIKLQALQLYSKHFEKNSSD